MNVLDTRKCRNEQGELHLPPGISWDRLKMTRKICEFASEESRAMGLSPNDVTFDKIIIKWKSIDVLEQLVKDGFIVPVLLDDGTVEVKEFMVATASSGQLRTDKIQCVSTNMWKQIHDRLNCGVDWEWLNAKGGVNVNKMLAYQALPCSSTDAWDDANIDECIVIKDFEAPVTGRMKYIKPDYTSELGIQTVMIDHSDGIGMMLPSVSRDNFMVRAPWIKGLLTSFDYLKFCEVHNVAPVITDYWGQEHDLVKENIRIIFTESQFKFAKYYDNWDQYKEFFKKHDCRMNRLNYEEDFIPDSNLNYQMLQTLTDFTDEEIAQFAGPAHDRIVNLGKSKESMLIALGATADAQKPSGQALYLYPELLREAYFRDTIKNIRKRWLYDARSGKIRCRNKRLFAIPDMFAACQFWFLHQKQPEG